MQLDSKTVTKRLAMLTAAVAALLAPAPSRAGGGLNPNFSVPSFYGEASITYQEWLEDFNLSGNSPPAASSNPHGTANFTDPTSATDGAFVIAKQADGSGDIYSFSGVINPQVVVPGAGLGGGYTTTIVFQFETYGQANPTLPGTVGQTAVTPDLTLTGSDGTSVTAATVRPEASASSPFGGFGTAYIATWTVAGNASSYVIDYDSGVTSSAWTSARVDTLTLAVESVPEPASIVSMSSGLLVMLGWMGLRRRRPALGRRGPSVRLT